MRRRQLTIGGGLAFAMAMGNGCAQGGAARGSARQQALFDGTVGDIERASGGRLGVAIRDTDSGRAWWHRADERFPLTSTFKTLAAACVLARVDRRVEHLTRAVPVQASDIVTYSPVVQPRVGSTMTMAQLCEAAVAVSDNAAGNLLLRSFGGPEALTAFVRTLGDGITRLDRYEPFLNEAVPGDPRDTTSPRAMLQAVEKLVLGDALAPGSRAQLTEWLLANKVGATRLRALLPAGWRIADKTGAGANGTNNDVGVLWPPGRAPVLVAAYLTGSTVDGPARDRAIADVGRLAAALVTQD